MWIILGIVFFGFYLYVGWYQPFKDFGKKPFSYRRKMVERLKEDDY
jgi:hypothetical protein